jgi:hypothetical protein
MDAAYRSGYRVETNVRDLTDEEAAIVQTRLREWNDQVRRQAMARVRELVFALPFAIGLVILAARSGWDGIVFAAGMMCVLFTLLVFVARRQALKTIAASRGPWHAPEGGWKMRDTRVVARSIVTAPGDDSATWVLFEIPGGDWFYVDAICLPGSLEQLARADVRFTRLWPDGVFMEVVSSGDELPTRDLPTWEPPSDDADGLIAESALPTSLSTRASTP